MTEEQKPTRKDIETEIVEIIKTMPEPLVPPKNFATDSTPEGMQKILVENGGRAALITDEGIQFEIWNGIYSSGRSNIDVFLKGHAGGELRVVRSGREVNLSRIAISIGFAIQSQVLEDLKKNSQRSFRGKGLFARFLPCRPKSNIGKRDVRLRKIIDPAVKNAYVAGIKWLLNIKPDLSPHNQEVPRLLTLSKQALPAWEQFCQDIENEQGEGGKYEYLQDFTGKLPGQALRIAALCQVAALFRQPENAAHENPLSPLSSLSPSYQYEIELDTMEKAMELCKKLIIHAQGTFELLDDDGSMADAKWALNWIKSHVETDDATGAFYIKQNALHKSVIFKNSKLERITKALDVLRERNIVSPQFKLPTPQKSTYVYFINPAVLNAVTGTNSKIA
jgi:putative DNA primase/helicase